MATRIDPDGSVTEVQPKGKTFSLGELQAVVGGDIEALYLDDGRVMYLNENGKYLQLLANHRATTLMRLQLERPLPMDDHIVGSVLLCTLAETGDDNNDDDDEEDA